MSKIDLNWITGKRLLERWNIDIRELDICIKSGLPVYNPDFELEEWGPIYNKIPNPDYDPNYPSLPKYIVNKNNLYDFKVLLSSSFPVTNTGLTKDKILNNLLFKLEDVEKFEKKHSKKIGIGSQPRKPISLDQILQDNSQDATKGVMSNIELEWISAFRLIQRWKVTIRDLYHIIRDDRLPIYNSIKKQIDPWFGQLADEDPEWKDMKKPAWMRDTTMLNFRKLKNNTLTPEDPDPKEILEKLLFKLEDVKQFEKRHSKTIQKENDSLTPSETRELGRLRIEKSKWDDSIKASLRIGLFCNELSKEGNKITRDMLSQKLFDLKFKDLPNTTIEKIWKAIPEKYRKKAGRPTKNKV